MGLEPDGPPSPRPSTPGQYGIRAIPTVLSFKDGQVVDQLQGLRKKEDFEAAIEKML